MAEALFRHLTEKRVGEFAVMSAGISAADGFAATPDTVRVLEDEGIDATGHQSQRLRPEMVNGADKIYVMEKLHKDWIVRVLPEAESKVHLLSEFAQNDEYGSPEDIPDPIRMSPSFYKNVLGVIRRCVEKLVKTL